MKGHFVYDLIYNPAETQFLKDAREKGAQTRNGRQMLVYQAEASWDIWTKAD
jgi:shikimate dehydrogenase